jgi:peptidyl-prolyl cis-trans isomerase C
MLNANWIKTTTLTGAILVAFAGLAGCQGNDQTSTAAKTPLGEQAANNPSSTTKVGSGKVIAMINGQPLYEENLKVIQGSLPTPMPEQRLVERMIELRLLAAAARKEGLDKQAKTQAQIENAIDNQLANDYLSQYMGQMKITDAELQTAYDKFVQGYPKTTQYKAAHILVKTKDEADAIIKQLDSGTPFDKLAEEKSQDPGSAKQGGDLGWFDLDQMVPEFSAAVAKLKKDQITQEPVHSKFGWHVIKLEDTRAAKPPTFAELKPQLETQLRRAAIETLVKKLRADAKVEITAPAEVPKPAAAETPKMTPAKPATSTETAKPAAPAPETAAPSTTETPAKP